MVDAQAAAHPLDRLGVFAGPVAGIAGFLVSVACLAVPLLHFVLGPLGPAIGGFVAGRIGGGGFGRVVVSALTMAAGMALVAAAFTGLLFGEDVEPGWARIAPAIAFVYTGALAGVGGFLGLASAPAD